MDGCGDLVNDLLVLVQQVSFVCYIFFGGIRAYVCLQARTPRYRAIWKRRECKNGPLKPETKKCNLHLCGVQHAFPVGCSAVV